ncbi:MAG: 7-cyano-7-deazaguanine synthase QueC [Alphaproteobacteria bacterium]|nr:MAG: 7-cyano-7-deazaguanine synthase QueC [Alphaproteobacteria bacterium]
MQHGQAIVLFSGGQDSAVCLAWALSRFPHVETVGFDYGQRHKVELEVRQRFLKSLKGAFPQWSERLKEDHLLNLGVLSDIGQTALTEDRAFAMGEDGLPTTFVPGRNLLFLTLAGALSYRRGCRQIVTGVCETDYSGYPDCRDDTIKSLQASMNLGMASNFVLHTPLMWLTKGETWALAEDLGGSVLVDLIVEETHTCYLGDREHKQDWGYGCGTCPACELRAQGWEDYQSSVQR